MDHKIFFLEKYGKVLISKHFDDENESGCCYLIVFSFKYREEEVRFFLPYADQCIQKIIFKQLNEETVAMIVHDFTSSQLH